MGVLKNLPNKNAVSVSEIENYLKKFISEETENELSEINTKSSFHSLGMDSINSILVMEKMENQLNIELNPIYFWDYPDIQSYSQFVYKEILNG